MTRTSKPALPFSKSLLTVGLILGANWPVYAADAATSVVPASPATTAAKPVDTKANTTSASASASPTVDSTTGIESIGQVIWVKGVVKAAQIGSTARILARRSPVYEHDVLTTEGAGTGEIAFSDSSVLTLREGSELRIDEYQFKKTGNNSASKDVMSLVKGGFRTITGAIPKANPDGYAVNTPVATIGVRGTDYSAYYSKEEGLMAKISAGRIEIKNTQGEVELSKELSHLYATIPVGQKPAIVQKEPVPFASQPPITPVSKDTINSIGAPAGPGGPGSGSGKGGSGGGSGTGGSGSGSGGGTGGSGSGSGGTGGSSGGSKTVSSFCVGLLHDFSKTVNDFFS